MDDRKPKGHGDWADLIRKVWSGSELRLLEEQLRELEQVPAYQAIQRLVAAREDMLIDRLVSGAPGDVRGTDQVIGMIGGLRQARRVTASIFHEANAARERAEQAGEPRPAEGDTA